MIRDPRSRAAFSRTLRYGAFVAVGVASGLLLATRGDFTAPLLASKDGPVQLSHVKGNAPLDSPFKAVAAKAGGALVFIEVKREGGEEMRRFHSFGGPFDEMFRQMQPEGDSEPDVVPSWGSGFFIEPSGYILTNNHVIREARSVRVVVSDDKSYDATVIGVDPATDVAVIRVDGGGNFPVLPLGDSDELQVGDWVMAAGNPFGTLQRSITLGIVSAKGRSDLNIMGGTPSYQDFIQTDASINYGNSGGPLINIRGEVVGINTAINPSGQGIGFAIPVNLAREIAEKLINEGRVVRGYIGIYPQEITPDLAEGRGIEPHTGILVSQVSPEGPADKAGLKVGDIITSFAGEPVSDVPRFRMLVARQSVDAKVDVGYLREGKRMSTKMGVAERPPEESIARAEEAPRREVWLGIQAEEVGGAEAERMGLKAGETAMVVARVVPGSPADDAGIERGDVILRINDKPVPDRDAYRQVKEEMEGRRKPVVFLIERGGITRYYPVRPRNPAQGEEKQPNR